MIKFSKSKTWLKRGKRRDTLFEKSNFCPKIQFWQNPNIFTSFSPKFFLRIFHVKSKLLTAKKSKSTTFSRVFDPKKIDNFLGKSRLNWTKNEGFEQCEGERDLIIVAQSEQTHSGWKSLKKVLFYNIASEASIVYFQIFEFLRQKY